MNVIQLKPALQLYLFQGKGPHSHEEFYLKAYQCWKNVWADVYQHEMKVSHAMYGDDFLKQDKIVALFNHDQCVGVAFIRTAAMNMLPWQEDSFFRFWPKDSLPEILQLSSNVALATYFTVHPEFRKSQANIAWKELLLALFMDTFCEMEAEVMITAARKPRSNEKLCQKLGAKLLRENVPYLIDGKPIEGEIADLVFWDKSYTRLEDETLEKLRLETWKNRIDCTSIRKPKGVRHAA